MSSNCSLVCPPLTELRQDGTRFSCEYEEWAYGLAAALLCFGALLPIALVICFWAKLKNASNSSKRKLHRQDSEASTFTDVSRPHDHGVYEVIRNDDIEDVFYRTRKGFPHHLYGTFSVPDMKTFEKYASSSNDLYPDLTQVHAPDSVPTSPAMPTGPVGSVGTSSRFSSEEGIPSRLARKRYKRHLEYDVNHSTPAKSVKFRGQKRKHIRKSLSTRAERKNGDKSQNASKNTDTTEEISGSTSSSEGISMDKGKKNSMQKLEFHIKNSADGNLEDSFSNCLSFQPTPPVKHLVEGMDFDLYLKDCVAKLPEDQRNGTFLVRDSQSSRGCKVLVVYCRGSLPSNFLFHYKLYFYEDGKVGIQGSEQLFSSLDNMLDFYRKQRTILPCLLSNCLGKSF